MITFDFEKKFKEQGYVIDYGYTDSILEDFGISERNMSEEDAENWFDDWSEQLNEFIKEKSLTKYVLDDSIPNFGNSDYSEVDFICCKDKKTAKEWFRQNYEISYEDFKDSKDWDWFLAKHNITEETTEDDDIYDIYLEEFVFEV